MFFYLEFLILTLPDMLLIDLDTVSEFDFTNSSFFGVFFTTCGAKDNIKKIRTITSIYIIVYIVYYIYIIVYIVYKYIWYVIYIIYILCVMYRIEISK